MKKTKEQIKRWIKAKNETKDRHENMDCKVYELKIDESKLSIEKKNHLNKLFIEAKWQYNHMLEDDNKKYRWAWEYDMIINFFGNTINGVTKPMTVAQFDEWRSKEFGNKKYFKYCKIDMGYFK